MNSKFVKRMLSFAVAAAMALTLMPAMPAKAADNASPESDFTWDGTTITGYKGQGGNIVIPNKATAIGDKAFYDKDNINSITLNANLQSIGSFAFNYCNNIKSVTIKGHMLKNVKLMTPSLGLWVGPFYGDNSLTTAVFSDPNLRNIPKNIFDHAEHLTTISIPDSVTSIGENAFCNCKELKINSLPSSLQTIGKEAFENCDYIKSITFPVNLQTIDENAFYDCDGFSELTLPSNVKELGAMAFSYCDNLQKVTVSGHMLSNVSSIYKSYELPGEVGPFYGCDKLTTAVFSDQTLKLVPKNIFSYATNLTSVSIPDSVTEIGSYAFADCSSLKINKLPSSLQTIGTCSFDDCDGISEIAFPVNMKEIGAGAFENCDSLKKITITGHMITKCSTLTYYTNSGNILVGPFYNCGNLTTVIFSDQELKIVPANIFNYAEYLNNVSMPDSVQKIDNESFNHCTNLEEISLPSSLQEVGKNVFSNCANLKKITFNNKIKGGFTFPESKGYDPLPSTNPDFVVEGYDGSGVDVMVARHNENNDIKATFKSLGAAIDAPSPVQQADNPSQPADNPQPSSVASVPDGYSAIDGGTFNNPNDTTGAAYEWITRNSDGATVVMKNGAVDSNEFISDGSYTYYVQADGTVMKDRLTYHPDGQHVIFFDANGHEVFNAFTHASSAINGDVIAEGAQYYFNVYGYMYVNTVTYDVTGTKLYYINPYGQLEHNGWFSFDADANYGDDGSKWAFTGSHLGFANYDGTLLHDAATFDYNGTPCYMQGNGEAAY